MSNAKWKKKHTGSKKSTIDERQANKEPNNIILSQVYVHEHLAHKKRTAMKNRLAIFPNLYSMAPLKCSSICLFCSRSLSFYFFSSAKFDGFFIYFFFKSWKFLCAFFISHSLARLRVQKTDKTKVWEKEKHFHFHALVCFVGCNGTAKCSACCVCVHVMRSRDEREKSIFNDFLRWHENLIFEWKKREVIELVLSEWKSEWRWSCDDWVMNCVKVKV